MLKLLKKLSKYTFVVVTGAGGLYDCLRGDSTNPCIMTPDVLELVRRYSGCNLSTTGSGMPGKLIYSGFLYIYYEIENICFISIFYF